MKKSKVLREAFNNIIFWALAAVSLIIIYFLVLKLIGRSPTALQIVYSLVIGLTFFVFKLGVDVGGLKGEFKEFKSNAKESFARVGDEFNEIKMDLKDMKTEIKEINKKLK